MGKTNNTRQAAWVAIGSLASFGFTIVSSAILSRYFNKGDYGTYKQVIYVYNTLLVVFTLGLPKSFSYFLPRVKPSEAKNLISKISWICLALGAIFSLLLFTTAGKIAEYMRNPDMELGLRYFAIVPLMMLPTMGLQGILSTYKRNMFMAVYTIATSSLMLLCVALPVVIFNIGYLEAIIGFVIASFFNFLLAMYLRYMPVRHEGNDKCPVTLKDIFKFSIPLFTASLWGIIIHSTDQFFISRYFGNEVFADFSNGSLELPFVAMIIGACSNVLSPIFSRMSHGNVNPQKEMFPLWMSVSEKTTKLIYPLVIYCWFFADALMVFLYGSMYEDSATFFRIKIIVDFFRISAFGPLMINVGMVKTYSRTIMWNALAVVLLEWACVFIFSTPYAISIVSVLCKVAQIFACFYFLAKNFNFPIYKIFPLRTIAIIIIPSAIFLLAEHWLLVSVLNLQPLWTLIISFAAYIAVLLPFAQMMKLNYMGLIRPFFNKK